jgi:hypothetical protein
MHYEIRLSPKMAWIWKQGVLTVSNTRTSQLTAGATPHPGMKKGQGMWCGLRAMALEKPGVRR